MFCSLQCRSLPPPWLILLKYFILFGDPGNRIVFLIFFSDFSLLVYRNTSDFCVCWFCSSNFVEFILKGINPVLTGILWDFLFVWFSTYKIKVSVNRDNFTSSFPSWLLFISLSYLVALARTWIEMAEEGIPELPLIQRKSGQSLQWVWCALWVCHTWPSSRWGSVLLLLVCWVFYHERCCITSNTFSTLIEMTMCFFPSFCYCDVFPWLICRWWS